MTLDEKVKVECMWLEISDHYLCNAAAGGVPVSGDIDKCFSCDGYDLKCDAYFINDDYGGLK